MKVSGPKMFAGYRIKTIQKALLTVTYVKALLRSSAGRDGRWLWLIPNQSNPNHNQTGYGYENQQLVRTWFFIS
jgi:hypothetical protein